MNIKHNVHNYAWVILPDHFHLVLKPAEEQLDRYIHDLKLSFGAIYRRKHKLQSGRVWQSRYWDHVIRNQSDFNHHVDYIHFNPVKHGLVRNPCDWQYSSIHDYLREGYYQKEWGVSDPLLFDREYGE